MIKKFIKNANKILSNILKFIPQIRIKHLEYILRSLSADIGRLY